MKMITTSGYSEVQPLGEVLKNIKDMVWYYELYLAGNWPWQQDTLSVIVDPNIIVDPDAEAVQIPDTSDVFKYVLSVVDVQGIVNNTIQHRPHATEDDLLTAFNFYYENDAFVVWYD